MSPIAVAISRALIHLVWQGAIIVFVLWATLALLKKRSANLRYAVSCVGLTILVLLPIVTTVLGYESSSRTAASPGTPMTALPAVTVSWAGSNSRAVDWMGWFERWMLPVWSVGVLLFSARLLWGYSHAIALGRRGEAADAAIVRSIADLANRMGIRRRIRVLISTMADVPSVVGWLRPIVLLPAASLAGLTPIQLEAVLAHELAHIRRFDYLINILQMLAETLFFYHPAVWWISKRIRFERELCCDDVAVQFSGDALSYARALTVLEKMRLGMPGLAMGSTNGPLLYRIQRIVGIRMDEHRPSRLSAAIAICLGLVCITLNTSWLRGQTAATPAHQEPPASSNMALDSPGVGVDLHSSSVIHRSAVQYPENFLKQGLKGVVSLEVTLDQAGLVADAHVLSGPQEFRKAALQSVLDWHFTHDAANSNRQISISFEPPPPESRSAGNFLVTFEGPVTMAAGEGKKVIYDTSENPPTVHWFTVEGSREALQNRIVELRTTLANKDLLIEPGQSVSQEHPTNAERDVFFATNPSQHTEQLKNLEMKFRARHAPAITFRGEAEGRTLEGIDTPGLSDSVRRELLSRMPIREGDILSADSIEATTKAVSEFDEHLEVGFLAIDNTHAEVRIFVAGQGGLYGGSWGGKAAVHDFLRSEQK